VTTREFLLILIFLPIKIILLNLVKKKKNTVTHTLHDMSYWYCDTRMNNIYALVGIIVFDVVTIIK